MELKCWIVDYEGMWPIGAYMLVFDYDEESAQSSLQERFNNDLNIISMSEVVIEKGIVIISTGDY